MARIVEVGGKDLTAREAVAEAVLVTTPETCTSLVAGTRKGDVIEAARVAGLMAVKRTADLLPYCHPVSLTGADVSIDADEDTGRLTIRTTVRATDRTGVEMEALTAAAIAALSLYDATKAYDRGAVIERIRLLEKRGGKSGEYRAEG
ncbi:MAG: cyclic pyranopterin monophosphate synthase MoaC [Actinobacteria bacterium]|nr:cyclic pyranopterin monophosphate synthase MoaC [Actinomycetota bacterium]